MTKLILIRHGQTQSNVAGLWEGWSDSPLTPLGRAQTDAVARRLAAEDGNVAALYTSPLHRACQTATAIGAALALKPVKEDGLKEINFGKLDGVSPKEMEAHYPELFIRWKVRSDMTFQWPGGEQRSSFFRRVAGTCDRILARHPGDRVVIVTHGGTLRACLAHLLSRQFAEWWQYTLDNCGITCVSTDGDGARLLVLNDNTHLPPGDDPQAHGR